MPPVDALSGGLLATGLLLLGSLAASRLGGRLGLPALLLFLVIGMLAGSDGPGGIAFENYALTQALGSIALVFILFNAGLETRWAATRPVLLAGLSLSTLGVIVTAAIVGTAAHWAANLPWIEALLFGAIVAPTDASAVFSVLKARALNLKGRIRPLLEFESGINDPAAVVLVTGLADLATHPNATPATLAGTFALELLIGALVGLAVGRLAVPLARNFPLPLEGLHSVLSAAIALTSYGLAATLHGSGFLAVYLTALVLANANALGPAPRAFHEGLSYLLEVGTFLLLGLLVFPSRLPAVAPAGLLLAAVLLFIARPLAVFTGLAAAAMPATHKAMVAWTGLRGAVPIILATFPLLAGVRNAHTLFNLTFFLVLASLLVQGTTIAPAARWLRTIDPNPVEPQD